MTPRNPWPAAIILTFVLFISGTIGLVVLACSQKADLVSSDYYEQEIRFERRLDQLDRTRRLERGPSVVYDAATHRIKVSLPVGLSSHGVAGRIQLYRPSSAGLDREIKFEPDSLGVQALDAANLRPGLWKVRVSWTLENQQYFLDQSIVVASKAS